MAEVQTNVVRLDGTRSVLNTKIGYLSEELSQLDLDFYNL